MFVNKRQKLPEPKNAEGKGNPQRRSFNHPMTMNKNIGRDQPTQEKKTEKKNGLDWDDISLSSDDSRSFQRFLKKPDTVERVKNSTKPTKPKKKDSSSTLSFDRPKTSRGELATSSTSNIQVGSSRSAVDRLAQIEARIKGRQQMKSKNAVSLSASDFNLDVSSDSEVKRDIGKSNIKLREKMKQSSNRKATSKSSAPLFMTMDASSESSDDNAHKRFLKGNVQLELSDDESGLENKFVRGQDTMPSQQVLKLNVSTDMEDSDLSMRAYMENLEREGTKRPSSPKKVTFATDLVRSSDLEQSLDDFMPASEQSEDVSSLDEVIPSKLHNIMSLDDLLPSRDVVFDHDSMDRSPSPPLDMSGLHSVDDLLPVTDVRTSSEYEPSMEEEIQVDSSEKSFTSSSDNKGGMINLRSVDDLQIDSDSGFKKPAERTKDVFRARTPVSDSDSEEIKSESKGYSEDFHSDDDTLKGTDSISQDLSAASVSTATLSIPEESSASERAKRDKNSSPYSSSFISSYSSHTSTLTSHSPAPTKRQKTKKMENIETQTEMTQGAWLPGSIYTDLPSFKPTRLIDNESLDVLTAYNPATLAIQDLLRQQVHITREFVDRSKRLHNLAVTAIPCDYVYGEVNRDSIDRLKKIWDTTQEYSMSTT